MNIRNIIYFTLCNEADFDKMDLIHQKQAKTKFRVIADKISSQLEPIVSPQPTSSGEYDYKGYHIKTANKYGGKAGRNHNRTSTLQITEAVGTGYYIKKQYSFIVGNKESYDKAWTKMIKWIDNNPLVAG